MNKTARNNALRDATRLLIADYNGQDWYTDTYIATPVNIFEGYRFKKSQEYLPNGVNGKPKMNTIIDNGRQYSQATAKELPLQVNDIMKVELKNKNNTELIQAVYYRLFQSLGADKYEIANEPYRPIKAYKQNKLIGVIMPLRV